MCTIKHPELIERVSHGKIKRDEWEFNQSLEIEDRLKSIVNLFGLHALRKCNIKIISSNCFDDLKYRKKVKYYEICINKLFRYICIIKSSYLKYKTMKSAMDNIGGYYFDYVDDLSEDGNIKCDYIQDEDELNDTDSINISLVKIGNPDKIYEKQFECIQEQKTQE